jgi:xanthine dehydrogenase accessory factor
MREIVDEVLAELRAGRDLALVRLVSDQGSTPRAAGAEMLVRRDGSIAGTIGGGLLEATMMRQATGVLDRGRSATSAFRLRGRDVDSADEMVCGGSAEVLIAYVAPGDATVTAVCEALRAAEAERRRAWLFTVLPAADGGAVEHCLLRDDGVVVGAAPCDAATLRKTVGKIAVHGTASLPDGREVVVEAVDPPVTAIICGAGHVGRALAPVAANAGWRVVVLDDREEFAAPDRFPGAQVELVASFDGCLSRVPVDERSYIIIVTRGHTHDMTVLEQALRTPARYVGLMSSRTTGRRIAEALRAKGFGDDDLARLRSPIGLAIGAETPAELAVSIVAEMIQVRAGDGR